MLWHLVELAALICALAVIKQQNTELKNLKRRLRDVSNSRNALQERFNVVVRDNARLHTALQLIQVRAKQFLEGGER